MLKRVLMAGCVMGVARGSDGGAAAAAAEVEPPLPSSYQIEHRFGSDPAAAFTKR